MKMKEHRKGDVHVRENRENPCSKEISMDEVKFADYN